MGDIARHSPDRAGDAFACFDCRRGEYCDSFILVFFVQFSYLPDFSLSLQWAVSTTLPVTESSVWIDKLSIACMLFTTLLTVFTCLMYFCEDQYVAFPNQLIVVMSLGGRWPIKDVRGKRPVEDPMTTEAVYGVQKNADNNEFLWRVFGYRLTILVEIITVICFFSTMLWLGGTITSNHE